MKIRFHEKLYRGDMTEKKLATIKRKVKGKSKRLHVFLVTLPVANQGLLEIYWYPELLQKAYQLMDDEMVVVGVAATREKAYALIKTMIEDIGVTEDGIPVKAYFEEQI